MNQGILTLITVAMVVAAAAFALWLLYTVIWRAVRRGLREYHRTAQQSTVPAPDLASRVLRPAPREVVPDYPPREWV
ncbi:MAG TPA: hypothetical protein VGM70_05435 [Pseudolysinimonas sp.]|jgi:hypothetical protein